MEYVKIHNKYSKSIKLLIKWGYQVYISSKNTKNELNCNELIWSAQKDKKIYTEENPLKLLGTIILSKEYASEIEQEQKDVEELEIAIDVDNFLLKPQK